MNTLIASLALKIVQDNALLFVGADLRREPGARSPMEQLADALASRFDYHRADRSLPLVAREYQLEHGRQALIVALRSELERVEDRPAPIHQLIADAVLPGTKVITTRFDALLERALEASGKPYVVIARDEHLSSFDETRVNLIKMQGQIDIPESLVITDDDVRDFISRLPTVSDLVRAYFATKTLIFLGYDLEGHHFKDLYRQVTRNLAGHSRRAYAVTAEAVNEREQGYWKKEYNIELCLQDPLAFLQALTRSVKELTESQQVPPNPLATRVLERPARPYKALESFGAADAVIFSGRREESQGLANRILGHRQTVLYGESGGGKTSLLHAGAGPILAQHRALLASCTPVPGQALSNVLTRSLVRAGEEAGLRRTEEPMALPARIRAWQQELEGPVVLAIDQFEQFFLSYGESEQQTNARFLSELIEDYSLDLKLVLVMREDFVGRLQTLHAQLPGLLDVRFRLERLGREEARAAIEEPARLYEIGWEPGLVQDLLDELYDTGSGGVAPPQLQLVCDRLFEEVSQEGASNGQLIRLETYQELGGAEGILGDYLERAVREFPPAQEGAVRGLLGALVNSRVVKQRLALPDLARVADVDDEQAIAICDELARQRLLLRYETAGAPGEPVHLAYELTHDYLARRIAGWLDDEFLDTQALRERVRLAAVDWQARASLPAPATLRLAALRRDSVRFAPEEREMLFGAAVAYGQDPAPWQVGLTAQAQRRVLQVLLADSQVTTRTRAVAQLAGWSDEATGETLAAAALEDDNPAVRQAAAIAIASLAGRPGEGERRAMDRLIEAARNSSTHLAARQALIVVRDLAPSGSPQLPTTLSPSIQRGVLGLRWRRHRQQIMDDTRRGTVGGFLGLGLGFAVLFGVYQAVVFASQIDALDVVIGLIFGGVVGALVASGAAFVKAAIRWLQDPGHDLQAWLATTLIGGLGFNLAFAILKWLAREPGDLSTGTPLTQVILGLLVIGPLLFGTAALPWRKYRTPGLAVAMIGGAVAFFLSGTVGWYTLGDVGAEVVLLSGALVGLGFFLAFHPRRPTPQSTAR